MVTSADHSIARSRPADVVALSSLDGMDLQSRGPVISLIGGLLSACLLLASCGDSSSNHRSGPRYVALGDSTVAGAGISASAGPCQRSDHNYAALLARQLKAISFHDAS